jgi:thiol-disulfide isomerase/thioredoxin
MTPSVLPDITGETWINSTPLLRQELAGKAVLVEFWNYSCVYCLRALPFLKRWWREFKGRGLLIIGVHNPAFDFEADPELVREAVSELGVEWPVVLDDGANWNRFEVTRRPSLYLANKEGRIVYSHAGEMEYRKTGENLRRLLGIKAQEGAPSFMDLEEQAGGICFVPTPDLTCGYENGALANHGGYVPDREAEYSPPPSLEEGSIALSGAFMAAPRCVEAAGEGAAIHVSFHATDVNLVIAPVGSEATVEVLLEGQPLGDELRGGDVSGAGEVVVRRPFMYNLLHSDEDVTGTLTVVAKRGRFRAYAFTFSGCFD